MSVVATDEDVINRNLKEQAQEYGKMFMINTNAAIQGYSREVKIFTWNPRLLFYICIESTKPSEV